jgi:alpha-mannosidase
MEPSKVAQLKGLAANAPAALSRWGERFLAEVDFAEGLATLHQRKAAAWRKLTDAATEAVAEVLRSGKFDRLPAAVRRAEQSLAPVGKAARDYTVYCVGHAHIDMNWLWSWPETVAVTNDTFATVLSLMEEFDEFCFTQSQASVYEIMRRYNPAALDEIKRRVAEGRWEVAAVHWVEGDKNLASGESLARHLLYTRRFTREVFGLEPEDLPLDWEPDTFGHAATIPSIVSRGAVRYYYMCRGGASPRPPVFWWQGPDGARILVNLETTGYNGEIGPHNAQELLAFCRKTGLTEWMNVYGVGDHGGGPTRRDILRAREMSEWPIFPNFCLSTTRPFYATLTKHADRWPVIEGELNFEFTGCYTSQSRIKRANRLGENYCVEAEAAAGLAHRALGRPYPAERLREAWADVLFGHFHDILPGSGIAATRHYQLGLHQKVAAATGMIKTHSLRGMADAVDTSFAGPGEPPAQEARSLGGGAGYGATPAGVSAAGRVRGGPRPFVVFNLTAWQRDEIAVATVWDVASAVGTRDVNRMHFVARTAGGGAVPAQVVRGRQDYWGHESVELAFPVSVGPLGYSTCVIEEGEAAPPEGGTRCRAGFHGWERQPVGQNTLENEFLEAVFDNATGGIVKLLDKRSGRDLADPAQPLAVPEYVLEQPRGMSAWIMADPIRRICPLEVVSLEPGLMGPYVASMAVKSRVNGSEVTLTYTLRAGQPWLEIAARIRWTEIGGKDGTPKLLMRFPFALSGARARYEVPFGSLDRDLNGGEEVPALRWADVSGKVAGTGEAAGCALLNDGKHGHSLDGATLRLTLLRSSWDPDPFPEVGDHEARMALVSHGERPSVADLMRLGAGFNHPLQVIATDAHAGDLPPSASGITHVGPDHVVVTSVKKCEDDEGLIVRLLETAGERASAKVAVDGRLLGRPAEAVEVDLIERPLSGSTAKVLKDAFSVQVPPRGIVSVKLSFAVQAQPRGLTPP